METIRDIYGLRICDIEDRKYVIKMELGPFKDAPMSPRLLKETLKEFSYSTDGAYTKGIRTYSIYTLYDDDKELLINKRFFIWIPVDYDELCSIINNNTKQLEAGCGNRTHDFLDPNEKSYH